MDLRLLQRGSSCSVAGPVILAVKVVGGSLTGLQGWRGIAGDILLSQRHEVKHVDG